MAILRLLAQNNFITFNKDVAKIVGIDAAILFGELCSLECMYGEEFFYDQTKLAEDTCLTEYRLRNALKVLKEEGVVNVAKKGVPAKNYYSLNEYKFMDMLESLDVHQSSSAKFDSTVPIKITGTCTPKSDTTNNNKENNKENKKEIIDIKPTAKKKRYGEYQNVLLTDQQYIDLQEDFPLDYDERIDRLDCYLEEHPRKHYANHLLTMRKWAKKDGVLPVSAQKKKAENDYSEAEAFFDELGV